MMQALFVTLLIVGIFLVLYAAAGLAIASYLFIVGKRTNAEVLEHEIRDKEYDVSLLDIPFEHFLIKSSYGYKLYARMYMAAKSTNKFMLVLHGRHSSSISQLRYLKMFSDLGYNVFFPDHRSCGESGGRYSTMGVYEKKDVITWLDFLQKKFPDAVFGMFGESLGAATAILTTALDPRIRVLISYCAFSSVQDIIYNLAGTAFPKWLKIFIPALYFAGFVMFGVNIPSNNVAKAAAKVKVPMLVMHSYDDALIDIGQARKILAANEKAEKVFFKGSEHARSFIKYPKEFSTAVTAFLNKHYCN